MSRMVFDGTTHQVSLIDRSGTTIGTWPAFNNVDRHATLTHLPNATFPFVDNVRPHPHPASPNGPYGSHGILRFTVPGHVGIGLHSGRATAAHQPGPPHPTEGCIRTTDDAMQSISTAIRNDPLSTIDVRRNDPIVAQHPVHQDAAHAHHQ